MRERASLICLILWALMGFGSVCLMATRGNYWPWFAVMALIAIVPLVRVGPTWQRILGAAFFIVSVVLIVADVRAGKLQEQKRHQMRLPHSAFQQKP